MRKIINSIELNNNLLLGVSDDHYNPSFQELWFFGGDETNTYPIGTWPAADFAKMTRFNGKIHFSATGQNEGLEWWASDGSVLGTQLVFDMLPGKAPSQVSFANSENQFFALGFDDITQIGLYQLCSASIGSLQVPQQICLGQTVNISAPYSLPGGTYQWVVPGQIITGQGTANIQFTPSETGTVNVLCNMIGLHNCPAGFTGSLTVTDAQPVTSLSISGPSELCPDQIGQFQFNPAISGNQVTWTVPTGCLILAGQGSDLVSVRMGTAAGIIQATPSNACGEGLSISVPLNLVSGSVQAEAGPDQLLCGVSSTLLEGNHPGSNFGQWQIISGIGGSFSDEANPQSAFHGVQGETYWLSWNIGNYCSTSTDWVQITFGYQNPPISAGPNQEICGTYTTLQAENPTVGTGQWVVVDSDGPYTLSNPLNPVSYFSGLRDHHYRLRWTTTNGGCDENWDETEINFYSVPPATKAGPPVSIFRGETGHMDAEVTPIGGSQWSFYAPEAQISDITDPQAEVFGVEDFDADFLWVTQNGACGAPSSYTRVISGLPHTVPIHQIPFDQMEGQSISHIRAVYQDELAWIGNRKFNRYKISTNNFIQIDFPYNLHYTEKLYVIQGNYIFFGSGKIYLFEQGMDPSIIEIPNGFVGVIGSNEDQVIFMTTANQLWRSDGTFSGTGPYFDNAHGYSYGVWWNNILYFRPNQNGQNTLWRTDGTSDGTYQLTQNINIQLIWPEENYLYFTEYRNNGFYVWRTDGTPGNEQQFISQKFNSDPKVFEAFDHIVIMIGNEIKIYSENGQFYRSYPIFINLNTCTYQAINGVHYFWSSGAQSGYRWDNLDLPPDTFNSNLAGKLTPIGPWYFALSTQDNLLRLSQTGTEMEVLRRLEYTDPTDDLTEWNGQLLWPGRISNHYNFWAMCLEPVSAIQAEPTACFGGENHSAILEPFDPNWTVSWTIENGTLQSGQGTPSIEFRSTGTGTTIIRAHIQGNNACYTDLEFAQQGLSLPWALWFQTFAQPDPRDQNGDLRFDLLDLVALFGTCPN